MPLRHPCYETCFWNASHLYRFYCHIMICWILKRCKRLRQMALWCQFLGLCRYLRGLMVAHITRGNMCCSTVAKDTRDCMEFLDCLNLSCTKFRSMKRTASRSRVAALVKQQRLKLTWHHESPSVAAFQALPELPEVPASAQLQHWPDPTRLHWRWGQRRSWGSRPLMPQTELKRYQWKCHKTCTYVYMIIYA